MSNVWYSDGEAEPTPDCEGPTLVIVKVDRKRRVITIGPSTSSTPIPTTEPKRPKEK